MGRVTYLLGAGASRQCLPIVTGISKCIWDLKSFLEGNQTNVSLEEMPNFIPPTNLFVAMIGDINELLEKEKHHASIDTYAKKLYLTNQTILFDKLKGILSLSFILQQLKYVPDPRYDSFFAAILNSVKEKDQNGLQMRVMRLSSRINIVSLNYDFQFEKAFSEYSQDTTLAGNQRELQVYPSNHNKSIREDEFSIFKVNGTTSFLGPEKVVYNCFEDMNQINDTELSKEFVELYYKSVHYGGRFKSQLSFAWENENYRNPLLDAAQERLSKSKAIVIIGYSFPFFNRQTDQELFKYIDSGECKIYIQDPKPEKVHRSLLSVLRADKTWNIEHVVLPLKDELGNKIEPEAFFLPPEL